MITPKVIDPSLFVDGPVTIDQWVNKQKECYGVVIGPFIKPSNYYYENSIYNPINDDTYGTMYNYFQMLLQLKCMKWNLFPLVNIFNKNCL